MSEVKVTKCPPGVALGAGDLYRWASRRHGGRSGMAGQRDKDLEAWARNPANVSRDGHALTPKQIRERRKAARNAKRKAELEKLQAQNRMRHERFKQRQIKRDECVEPDQHTPDASPSDERPPWE
jgi:hypothetical protein